jgi:hypothetical protein
MKIIKNLTFFVDDINCLKSKCFNSYLLLYIKGETDKKVTSEVVVKNTIWKKQLPIHILERIVAFYTCLL